MGQFILLDKLDIILLKNQFNLLVLGYLIVLITDPHFLDLAKVDVLITFEIHQL